MSQPVKIQPVLVKILGKDYRIACADGEQEMLLQSAQALDMQMREIRDSGKVNGTDRIAIMAALNLTHELRSVRSQSSGSSRTGIAEQLARLRFKIENILEN
jgi:cell division protein ZapA